MQKQLFQILNHMKRKCAYYPMRITIPPQRIWGGEILDKLAALPERNYFIPVGTYDPGEYRMTLSLEKDVKVTIHMISEEFDMVVEDCYLSKDKQIDLPITIEDYSGYYVRLYPHEPVRMSQLVIANRR